MQRLILTVSLLGCLLFGAVFAVSFISPSIIDHSARAFVIHQIEKEIAQYQAKGVKLGKAQEKIAWLKERYADEITSMKTQVGNGLRVKITDVLNKICNVECLQKNGIKISDVSEEALQERIAKLSDVSEKLSELIKGKYYGIISELLSDIRIFSGINAILFLLIALVLKSRSLLVRPLILPTGLLFAATVISIVFIYSGRTGFIRSSSAIMLVTDISAM